MPIRAEIGSILAHHWREGGEPARRCATCSKAAGRTADALAVEETYDLYSQALDLADTDDERR